MTVLGFFLGNVPIIANNIDLVLVIIVAVSVLPMVVEGLLERRRRRAAAAAAARITES